MEAQSQRSVQSIGIEALVLNLVGVLILFVPLLGLAGIAVIWVGSLKAERSRQMSKRNGEGVAGYAMLAGIIGGFGILFWFLHLIMLFGFMVSINGY